MSPHFLGDLPKPIQGPDVPPPRFQRPGGQYAAPAQDRVAIHVKQELVKLELSLQQTQASRRSALGVGWCRLTRYDHAKVSAACLDQGFATTAVGHRRNVGVSEHIYVL